MTVLAFLVSPAAAQVDRAALTGTVTDASGAVLVDARVKATHEGSGQEREGIVGTSGAYVIPQLPIGTYTVQIEAPGFKGIRFDKVQLLVGQTRTLDAKLDIAATSTQVEVRDSVIMLDRTTAEIGSVIQSFQFRASGLSRDRWWPRLGPR